MIKIAICDDEPIICSLYQTKVQFILKEHESEASIDTYTQPLKFLEALKVQEYDLILLDIDMPEISGLQLAEKIQELPERQNHGYGIRQIRQIAKKYDGLCRFFEEDGMFCAAVMIPS